MTRNAHRVCATRYAATVLVLLVLGAPHTPPGNAQVASGLPGAGGMVSLIPVPDTLPLPPSLGEGTPAFPVRAFEMSLVYARDLRIFPMADILTALHRDHFSHVILQIDNVAGFGTLPEMTTDNTLLNMTYLKELVAASRAVGLDVVIGVDLLGRQDVLFAPSHPEALLNRTTLDIRTPAARALVTRLLTEIVDSLQVSTVLIGHEAARYDSLPPETAQALFVESVKTAHAVLAARGVRTAIYGASLLRPRETGALSGCRGGAFNTVALRRALPRDLIVLDRHDTPRDTVLTSIDSLRAAGLTVWSTTGIDRVSRAASARQARQRGAEGVVLSTADFLFRRGGPIRTYREMRHAATVFWNPAATPLPDPGALSVASTPAAVPVTGKSSRGARRR